MIRKAGFRLSPRTTFSAIIFSILLSAILLATAGAGEKITIGEVEDVVLMPWGVKLPARIDTGAATSSLDARDLRVINNTAEFRLPTEYGGRQLRLPVVDWKGVRGAGFQERRPIVSLTICLGPRLIRARVTLNDRRLVTYPFLVGRNILKENFIVDCDRIRCLPRPDCPAETRK